MGMVSAGIQKQTLKFSALTIHNFWISITCPSRLRGIETAFRAPGYPFFLALLYLFVPESFRFILARLAQVCLAASLAPFTAILCNQIGFFKESGHSFGSWDEFLSYSFVLSHRSGV